MGASRAARSRSLMDKALLIVAIGPTLVGPRIHLI